MAETRREPSLWLGTRRGGPGEVALPVRALLRHAIALGSSGSGKTVFCKVVVEEAVRRGIPVIAIDPQGDIASLALGADPVNADAGELAPDERAHALTRTASRITALLGYDVDSDEGTGVRAVVDRCLTELAEAGKPAQSLGALMEHLNNL